METTELLHKNFTRGFKINGYSLLETIGLGGEAYVWSAWDEINKRIVAIKLFHKVDEQGKTDDIYTQLAITSRINHQFIQEIYEVGSFDRYFYQVMRYYPLGSLKERMQFAKFTPKEVIQTAAQIGSALEFIHGNNIVHRDLKPTNILINVCHQTFLTDFGIAKPLSQTTEVLHTGHGTLVYSSPEHHTLTKINPKADIYSFGILLYEMFTGKLPWDGIVSLAIMQLDSGEELPDPREHVPSLPIELARALRIITDINPDNRPSSASEAIVLVATAFKESHGINISDNKETSIKEKVSKLLPQFPDPDTIAEKEAKYLLEINNNIWEEKKIHPPLTLSHIVFLDSILKNIENNWTTKNEDYKKLMLLGAQYHGINHEYWWERFDDPKLQLQVCEILIGNESEEAIRRIITLLMDETHQDKSSMKLSTNLTNKLIQMGLNSSNSAIQGKIFEFINNQMESEGEWRPIIFSKEDDLKLASTALKGNYESFSAARLIGKIRSKTAVQFLWENWINGDTEKSMKALTEVRNTAGNLPKSISLIGRIQIWVELAWKQLIENRKNITRIYYASALACALGLSFHVFLSLRLPSLVILTRILNTLGSGLIFGPILGFGIFITRLFVQRLKLIPLISRIILSTILGGFVVNIGFVIFHIIFLVSLPEGLLIGLGSFLFVLGFGLGPGLTQSKFLRIFLSILTISMGIGLSWVLSLNTGLSPMIYYERNNPIQTTLLIIATSSIIGIVSHYSDFSGRAVNLKSEADE